MNDKLKKELLRNLDELDKLKNYDNEKLMYALVHQTSQLLYFYKTIAKGKDTLNVNYKRKENFYEHKLVYVNLDRGFPKELMDGHWCYVLKDFGVKVLVVPTTSIKPDSVFNPEYDKDIRTSDGNVSRLCISEIRTIDIQRIDSRKKSRDVIDSVDDIKKFVAEKTLK